MCRHCRWIDGQFSIAIECTLYKYSIFVFYLEIKNDVSYADLTSFDWFWTVSDPRKLVKIWVKVGLVRIKP